MKIDVMRCQLVREDILEYSGDVGQISDSKDAVKIFRALGFEKFAEEVVGMLTMSASGEVTSYCEVSRGTLTESLVHPREVFKRALLNNACAIILAHNHPSGSLKLSKQDIEMTKGMKEAGDLLGIRVLDHIIIGSTGKFLSCAAEGLLEKEEKI